MRKELEDLRDMEINSKKPLVPEHMQQLKGKGNSQAEGSKNPSLIKRMGLEDQLLMVCLGLPFRMPTNSFKSSHNKIRQTKMLLMEGSRGSALKKISITPKMHGI